MAASDDIGAPFTAPGWFPAVPVTVRCLDDTPGAAALLVGRAEARLLITTGQYHPCRTAERLWDSVTLQLYYSDADDREPPRIGPVTSRSNGASTTLTAGIEDESGIARAVVVHTRDDGVWTATDMVHDPATGTWQAEMPAAAYGFLQAVDAAGNVTVRDNGGRYFGASLPCGRLHAVFLPAGAS